METRQPSASAVTGRALREKLAGNLPVANTLGWDLKASEQNDRKDVPATSCANWRYVAFEVFLPHCTNTVVAPCLWFQGT